jgi:DNA invertase Pin-like site-specific DNA recombinase
MKAVGYILLPKTKNTADDKLKKQSVVEEFAKSTFNCEVMKWYVDKTDSKVIQRPELEHLLEDAQEKQFQLVFVASLSDLGTLAEQLFVRELLSRHDANVWSVMERSKSGDGKAYPLLGFVQEFIKIQRAHLTIQQCETRKELAGQGLYAGGRAPMGYTMTKGSGKLTLDPVAAQTIRLIFSLRSQKLSMRDIANKLNSAGITTATGSKWHETQVKRVLDREALYRGHYSYAGITADQGQQQAILHKSSDKMNSKKREEEGR